MKRETKTYLIIGVCILGLCSALAIFSWSLDNKQYLFSFVSIFLGVVSGTGYGMGIEELRNIKHRSKGK